MMFKKTSPLRNRLCRQLVSPLGDERGMALIIALSLLAIMSILGAMLLSSSTTEILLSRNAHNNQQAFYVADRAVAYSMQVPPAPGASLDLYNDVDTSVIPNVTHRSRIELGRGGLELPADCASGNCNTITPLTATGAPAGQGFDTTYKVSNYMIDAAAVFPAGTPNPSRASLQAQVSVCCFKESN